MTITTWNPSDAGTGISLSSGNTVETVGSTVWYSVRATTSKSSGKWYVEENVSSGASGGPYNMVGFATAAAAVLQTYLGSTPGTIGLQQCGSAYNGGGFTITGTMPIFAAGDTIGLAVDFDAGNLWVSKNGAWLSSGNPGGGTNPFATFAPNTALFPAASSGAAGYSLKIVPLSVAYPAPSGFQAWDYTTPPPSGPYGEIISNGGVMTMANNVPGVLLVNTSGRPCNHMELVAWNVIAATQPGALLTMYASVDGGATFDRGSVYNSTGTSLFPGESNQNYMHAALAAGVNCPAPYGFGLPQTLQMGMRLGIDVGDTAPYGVNVRADIWSPGAINGVSANTIYFARGYAGATGGLANGARPSILQPPATWFPSDGSAPFEWAIPINYAGHYAGAPGQQVNALYLDMSGGGASPIPNIANGEFALRCLD